MHRSVRKTQKKVMKMKKILRKMIFACLSAFSIAALSACQNPVLLSG